MNTKTQVHPYHYDRNGIKAGILHIGVGNFHRAHEEYYTNRLLEYPDQQEWGICGAMLLPGDERLYRILKRQDCEYTLTVCGRDGHDEAYRIGSLVGLLWGVEAPEAVLDKIADRDIRIISMTITEGGYNIEKSTGEFMFSDRDVQHDLKNPQSPRTVFGFIAEGLRRRMTAGNGPVTILSCDNLQHNGNTARKAFTSFIQTQDKELALWVKDNVTFPNSMVDRITPATRPEDVIRLNEKNGTDDNAPVYCEDFIQWVIEDNFIAGRPAWENVGVEFTSDVTGYENMKLSLLNASHTLLSYPSFLSGYRKVDDAMHDERIAKFVRTFMDKDITPYVPAPGNTDLDLYKQTLVERFGNRSVSDQISRLCFDGISKFPVYVMPNLIKMIRDHADLTRVAYLIAAYRHYLKYRTDDNGAVFEIAEPWMTKEDETLTASDNPMDFLGLSAFKSTDLKQSPEFVKLYAGMVENIRSKGAMATLETILK
ncbi:MAG TPA: mannitol dehydrogenase family protein [Candidatus Cryptobacteroides intestinipullorum]|nr:mannitol dehydrogenase family protein [Candidatus Cryptobacteroides intestinipullorum]